MADGGGVQPLISIVMLSWNRCQELAVGLSRIAEIDWARLEVIVVDNGSSDGTVSMVRNDFPHVILIEAGDNLGIAGYNLGFERATGDYLLVLDDDSYPLADAPRRMVAAFEQDPTLGVVAFTVRNAAGYDAAAAVVEWDEGETSYQMSFNGAGFGIRRVLFRDIGWYPAEYFLYMNELDVALRVIAAGYRIATFRSIVALHHFSPRNRASERAPFYYTRNAFWLVWKYYPSLQALMATFELLSRVVQQTVEQGTAIYLKAAWAAWSGRAQLAGKRRPLAVERLAAMRISFDIAFSSYR